MRRMLPLIGMIALAGCAMTEMRLSQNSMEQLGNRTVYIVKEAPPSFGAVTSGKAMFAVAGALAAHSEGETLVKESGIDDPSVQVENRVAQHIHQKYGSRRGVQVLDFTTADKPSDAAEWAAAVKDGGIVVDVETRGWNFWYFPATWSRYRVGYSAVLRLIDGRSGKVLSQYLCASSAPENADDGPTYNEMLANRAERLKKMLRDRGDVCAQEMISKVL